MCESWDKGGVLHEYTNSENTDVIHVIFLVIFEVITSYKAPVSTVTKKKHRINFHFVTTKGVPIQSRSIIQTNSEKTHVILVIFEVFRILSEVTSGVISS